MVVVNKGDSQELSVEVPAVSPPPYAPSSSSSSSPPTAEPLLRRVAPPIARCNHVAIKRVTGHTTGSFVIDPELDIPESMLSPPVEGQERRNLSLDVNTSNIDVDVWVVEPPSVSGVPLDVLADAKYPRTTMEFKAYNIAVRLHSSGDRPFTLDLKAGSSGIVNLELPHTFCGPLTIRSVSGTVTYSRALQPMVATFSDYDGIRKCFVGDFRENHYGEGEWRGSSVEIDTHGGKVNLRFADEPPSPPKQSKWWGSFGSS